MGQECASDRQLLCFGLEFALAFAGLCESISLFWLELWSMPRHRFAAIELMPHELQEAKTKGGKCLWTDRAAECLAPGSCRLSFANPTELQCRPPAPAAPPSARLLFAAEVGHPPHQGVPKRAPHVQGRAAAPQNGAHHREQEQLAGPTYRGAAGQVGHRPRRAACPPQAATRRLDDRRGYRHVQPAEGAGGEGQSADG